MTRLLVYSLAWVLSHLMVFGAWAVVLALALFFTALAPVASVWAGARLALWMGMAEASVVLSMAVGLWLFGSIRAPLFRIILRRMRTLFRLAEEAGRWRDGLWPQYRRQAAIVRQSGSTPDPQQRRGHHGR